MRTHEDLQKFFTEAYDRHMEEIFRFFAYRLSDRERAKDLTQETFMKAWKYAAEGKEIREIRPFLFTTAGNLYKNELRGRKPVVSLESYMETTGAEPAAETPAPDRAAEARLLAKSLEQLEDSYREVLMLRFFDGLSSREIAAMLGESETAIAVRVHRAVKKLKAIHTP